MSDDGLFLLPFFGFFAIAALGAWWQARNPEREIAARQRLLERDLNLPRWRQLRQWDSYLVQQNDPVRYARSAGRRAIVLTAGAALVGVAILLSG